MTGVKKSSGGHASYILAISEPIHILLCWCVSYLWHYPPMCWFLPQPWFVQCGWPEDRDAALPHFHTQWSRCPPQTHTQLRKRNERHTSIKLTNSFKSVWIKCPYILCIKAQLHVHALTCMQAVYSILLHLLYHHLRAPEWALDLCQRICRTCWLRARVHRSPVPPYRNLHWQRYYCRSLLQRECCQSSPQQPAHTSQEHKYYHLFTKKHDSIYSYGESHHNIHNISRLTIYDIIK